MKQVVNKDIYDIALNRRTGLKSIYLKLYTGDSTSNIFQVYCDYGDINDYDLYEDTSFVNLPDSKRPKHWKHNSRYGCPSKKKFEKEFEKKKKSFILSDKYQNNVFY